MAPGERRFDDLWAAGWSLRCRRRRRQRHHVRSRRRHIGRTWSESPGGQCTSPWHEGNLIEHGSAFPSQDSGASGLLRMTEATASGSEVGNALGASNASTVSHVRCLLSGLEPRRLVGHQRMLKCAEKALRSRSKPFASAPFKLPVCRYAGDRRFLQPAPSANFTAAPAVAGPGGRWPHRSGRPRSLSPPAGRPGCARRRPPRAR